MDLGFALNVPEAGKSFSTHMMELLGDMDHVESRLGRFGVSLSVGSFGDSANLDAR
jgi:hypothetical protein